MMQSMTIFFVLSRAEHARMWRRVARLRPFFAAARVAAFERSCSPVRHDHPFERLGTISHRKFFNRIPIFLGAARKCLGPVRKSGICYAFSLDILLLLLVLKGLTRSKARLVYEVADIHPSLTSRSLRGRLLRRLERALIRRSRAVVLTSPAFHAGYFRDVQRFVDFPSVVIEHKVELPAATRDHIRFRPPSNRVLVIGYIGLMKSPDSFRALTRIAEAAEGRIAIHFHGRFVPPLDAEECLRLVAASPSLKYWGPYRSPEDIERVYTSVDMVWDAYREGENARWQRTTRFSEACFFKRPLIYNRETQDGRMAEHHGLGMAMSFDRLEACIQELLDLDEARLREWFNNFNALPRNLVFYEREYEDLVRLLVAPSEESGRK